MTEYDDTPTPEETKAAMKGEKFPRSKKHCINNTKERQKIVEAAKRKVLPPAYMKMSELALTIFDEIIAEKANAVWSAHQASIAAIIARHMAQLVVIQDKLEQEGSLIKDPQTNRVIVNPRKKLIEDSMAIVNQTRKGIGLQYAGNQYITPTNQIKRNSLELEIQNQAADVIDDLIKYDA